MLTVISVKPIHFSLYAYKNYPLYIFQVSDSICFVYITWHKHIGDSTLKFLLEYFFLNVFIPLIMETFLPILTRYSSNSNNFYSLILTIGQTPKVLDCLNMKETYNYLNGNWKMTYECCI